METVGFIAMGEGTKADYDLLARYEEAYIAGLADRLFVALERLRYSNAGYQVTPLRALVAVGDSRPSRRA